MPIILALMINVRVVELYAILVSPLFMPGNRPKYFSLRATRRLSAPYSISRIVSGGKSYTSGFLSLASLSVYFS